MKFKTIVEFYKVNDDCTVTVKNGDQYFRCKARLDVLNKVSQYKQGDAFEGEFGLAYVRGQGLVLQLISC